MDGRNAGRTVQLAITDACNLACIYCFAGNKSKRTMSSTTACAIAASHLDDGFSSETIEFDFAGGEPLLAFDVMQEVVRFVHSRTWKRKHVFGFTTNGTLLDDEVKKWLEEHPCVHFSISLDGTREAHNANRGNSYDKAVANVPWLLDRCRRLGLTSSTKMTISPQTIGLIADGVMHLHALGFEEVNANVPYEDLWSDVDREAVLLSFAAQLDRLVEFYTTAPGLKPPQLVKLPIHRIFSKDEDQFVPRWCGSGRAMVCYDTDGRAYPCHRFVPLAVGPRLKYDGASSLQPGSRSLAATDSACINCPLIKACPSCMGFNWQTYGNPDARTRFHCPFMLIQFKASAKLEILTVSAELESARFANVGVEVVRQLEARLNQAIEVINLFL